MLWKYIRKASYLKGYVCLKIPKNDTYSESKNLKLEWNQRQAIRGDETMLHRQSDAEP